MHFFMSKIITFTKGSDKRVFENLRSPTQLSYGRSMSSKLLNYQIKREVYLLQLELTVEVLEELQAELRRKSKGLWATLFCVIMILSMCMEAVQLAIDGFIVQGLLKKDVTNISSESRADGFQIGRRHIVGPAGRCCARNTPGHSRATTAAVASLRAFCAFSCACVLCCACAPAATINPATATIPIRIGPPRHRASILLLRDRTRPQPANEPAID